MLDQIAGDGLGGNGITLVPRGSDYSNVVVWLHGLGDTADGWSSRMPEFKLKDTKFILPTADTRPVALTGGNPTPAWADIFAIDLAAGQTDFHIMESPEDIEGFKASANRVLAILESEKANGKMPSRMVVGGFSQGGALALHVCLRATEPLAGCVACSTWVPMNKDYPAALGSGAKDIPVAQFHGTRDEVVLLTWGQRSHRLMKEELGVKATFDEIPDMGHSACPGELKSIGNFLQKVLPDQEKRSSSEAKKNVPG
ncbi:unnamed protein product [Pylaiella littoralis]